MLALLAQLLPGLAVTVALAAASAALAVPLALVAALGRLSSWRPARAAAATYIEIFRGTSALVQLFWVYYALPLLGVELGAFAAAVTVLGLNTAAYGAEVVRGAIRAVPRGQWEAATALSFSRWQTLRWIIVPQALVAALPPATNLLVELVKNTALVSLVTVADLTFRGQLLRAATLRSGEVFGAILVLYFALSMVLVAMSRRLERRLDAARGGARGAP